MFDQISRRKQLRLKDYDYNQPGMYFITICTQRRICWLGKIENGNSILSNAGKIVEEEWLQTAKLRPYVDLYEYVIMPNHFHGILSCNRKSVATQRVATTKLSPDSVGSIIGQFKSTATKRLKSAGLVDFGWQRNYYEHVIRNEDELTDIREYVNYNPAKWMEDKENPDLLTN